MTRITKTIFIVGLILLIYGYLCRSLNIYFFWDSKLIGWIIILIGLIGYLIDLIKLRRIHGKKTFWVKMAIGIIIFQFVLFVVVIFKFKNDSEAYDTAMEYLTNNTDVKNEIGNIKGFGLIPFGSAALVSTNDDESGSAIFMITVRGEKKYKDVEIHIEKTPETVWTVTSVR